MDVGVWSKKHQLVDVLGWDCVNQRERTGE